MPALETQVDAVMVYTDRARVTRRGKLRLPAGTQEVTLENLPVVLVPESVRAGARAGAPARLLSTDVARSFHKEPVEARPAELQAELEALQERDAALARRYEALIVRRSFLQTFAASAGEQLARGVALGRATIETGAGVGRFLGEQLGELDDETLQVERERREVGKELAAVRSRLDALQRRTPTERKRVTVLLALEAEAEVEIEVSYQVTGASWEPLYDLRLTEGGGAPRLSLGYQAQVTQATGEPWDAVSLSLSTAKPALSARLPELEPWYLHAQAPSPVYAGGIARRAAPAPVPAAQASSHLSEEDGMAFDAEETGEWEALPETAVVEEGGPSVTFHLPGCGGVPDDGSPHKVTLGSHDFPARLDYVTAPKLVTQAYRRARVTNASAVLLLPGCAQIFHEEEFVGTTSLKTVAPGQEFELFLGVDDRIQVERKLVEGSVDRKFLADVRRMTYAWEIKLVNLTGRRETVTVVDQMPVSRHESVKVRRGEVRPAPAGETEMGRLTWELPLDPGQERLIRFGFTIEGPRGLHLTGLPPLKD